MKNLEIVQDAVKHLANICDGAIEEDGQGFNKLDSSFGKSLARQEFWTVKQGEAALKMLRKYKKQLDGAGFPVTVMFQADFKIEVLPKKTPSGETKKAVLEEQDKIKITFPFDWTTVNLVKTIPGRQFNPKNKYWTCPISDRAIEILKKDGFTIDEKIVKQMETPVVENTSIELNLKKTLYPFQKEGVSFIEAKNGRALLADEMGLGKTIQAIAWISLHPEKRPVVILVPAHLKLNWAKEIRETLPEKNPNIQILQGKTPYPITGEYVIINYDILDAWLEELKKVEWEVLIFDEAHYIKNNKALRTKATKKLSKGIPHVLALTGTPIVNRPIEGFNIFGILNKSLFPNWWTYVHTYCGAHHNGFGWDFTGATNKEELHDILIRNIMVRRKKADVLPDLPDKLFSFVPMEITNQKEYKRAEADFIEYLKEVKGEKAAGKAKQAEHLVRIEGLKQLAIKGKMKQAVEWVRDYLDQNGNKLVIFAVHKFTVDTLIKEFGEIAVKIDGSVNAEQRNKAVEEFQNNPNIKLFVGNIKAAGTGLTLTASSSVAFLELPWTPGELVQAEDRCHRIGQKDTVNIYYLLANETIEEDIAYLLDEKKKVLDAVLDGKEATDIPLLTELMEKYENKEDKKCWNGT